MWIPGGLLFSENIFLEVLFLQLCFFYRAYI